MSKLILILLVFTLFFTQTLSRPTRPKSVVTMYWVTSENDFKPSGKTTIRTCQGKSLATVKSNFAEALRIEGTGITSSGKMFNLGDCDCGDGFSCFTEVDTQLFPFGISSNDEALDPFASAAANDFPIGTKLFVPAFKGLKLPNGLIHNGCVKVADRGYGFGANHIDWFVSTEANYNQIANNVPETTIVKKADCELLKYTDTA
ncbi:7922_t:CDS:1 [Paraglomus occultum]|uniref:7922_t:CDS:1 n=1 Tax=Paraglomus occultum TaxID=144539 RepID=A0A9N9GI05_9GLOM|nr:7922_t:CDS:1 [Paraglomus occultum]